MSRPYPRDLRGYGRGAAARALAGRCAHRAAVRAELRGGRRELRPARRRRQRAVPVRDVRPRRRSPRATCRMESLYEYGSRVGVWRILREFERRRAAAHGVRRRDGARAQSRGRRRLHASSATRSPAMAGAGSTTRTCDEATEREHMARAIAIHRSGSPASGRSAGTPGATARTRAAWSPSTAASRTTATTTATTCRSGCRCGGATARSRRISSCPYTLDANDMRFALPQGFSHGDEFFAYLRDASTCCTPRARSRRR